MSVKRRKFNHLRRGYNNMNPDAWYNVFYTKPGTEIRKKKGSRKMVKRKKRDDGFIF